MTSRDIPQKLEPNTSPESLGDGERPFEESDDAKFAHALSNKPGSVAQPRGEDTERTITNRPVDPNSVGEGNLPPGVDADTARDPGANTPSSGKVDNRS